MKTILRKTPDFNDPMELALDHFAKIKAHDGLSCFFASTPEQMCDAERRRLVAISNGPLDESANALLVRFPAVPAEKVFTFDAENALEIFPDGSLYEKSSADSSVWAFAWDFFVERVQGIENPDPKLLAFFGVEEEEAQ